jgi:hypothetical protein
MYTTDLSVNCNNYYMNCRVAANGFGSCNHGSVSGWARSLFLHSLDAETHDSINGYEFVKSFRRTLPNRYSSAINYQNCSANFEINIDYQLSGALVSFSAMNKNATSYQWQIVGFGNPIYTTNDTSSHFYPYTNYADWQAWLIGLVIHDNVNACSDTVTQEFIIVNPNWVSPANCTLYQQPQSQTVYAGSDVQFIIHTNSGVSKQWQQDAGLGWDTLTNAGPFTGVNTDTLTVHNVQIWWNNYHYRCLISNDSNNCHNMTSEAILTVQVVGIDEIANQNSFSISPNPFHTTGTLHLNPSFSQAELKIYNVLGGEVKRQKITSQTTVISRDGMADGIYFISVNDGEKEWRGRVVVE